MPAVTRPAPPLHAIAYEHAAALIGRSPWEASRDPGLLVEAHARSHRLYDTAGEVLGIDVYLLEAEAMGARVGTEDPRAMPAIERHPLASFTELGQAQRIDLNAGRLTDTLGAADAFAAHEPAAWAGVPLAGPYAVASGLVGMTEVLMAAADEPCGVAKGLVRLVDALEPWHEAVRRSGHRPVVFESGVAPPLMSPPLFRDAVRPALERMLERLGAGGRRPILIIGGDASAIAEDLATLPTASLIAPRETNQPAFLSRCPPRDDRLVRVNMDSRVFAGDDFHAVEAEWRRARDIVSAYPHTSVGTGVLPFDANPETVRTLLNLATRDSLAAFRG